MGELRSLGYWKLRQLLAEVERQLGFARANNLLFPSVFAGLKDRRKWELRLKRTKHEFARRGLTLDGKPIPQRHFQRDLQKNGEIDLQGYGR